MTINGLNMFKGLKSLEEAIALGAKGAPVDAWNPDFCGDSGMRIDGAGRWFHNGSEIKRQQLVALFASVLKVEKGRYFLVTPFEKLEIEVEDAPFLITDVRAVNEEGVNKLHCVTSLGQGFRAGEVHPLKLYDSPQGFKVYGLVRAKLYGVCSRAVCLALSDMLETHKGQLGLFSAGRFFPVEQGSFNIGGGDV